MPADLLLRLGDFMAINKVIFGSNTLIDLTSDTVTASRMFKGDTAHAADGSSITGTAEVTVDGTKLVMPEGFISVPASS